MSYKHLMRTSYFGFSEYFESCFKAEQCWPEVYAPAPCGPHLPIPQLWAMWLLQGLHWEECLTQPFPQL